MYAGHKGAEAEVSFGTLYRHAVFCIKPMSVFPFCCCMYFRTLITTEMQMEKKVASSQLHLKCAENLTSNHVQILSEEFFLYVSFKPMFVEMSINSC
jgi:hypothetical protein